MIDERWNGLRLELAAMELACPEPRQQNLTPLDREIQGVVFELCGVLYDDSAWRRWLWQLVGHIGLHTHYTPFFRVWDCEFQQAVWSGELDLWSALGQFLLSAGLPRPDIDEVIAATRARFRRFEQDTRPFPGVRDTVRQLRANDIQIAVIAHDRLSPLEIHQRLDQVGIGKQVTHVLSRQHESPPQNLAAWQQASLESLPGPASSWIFVGRQHEGLELAARLGLVTVAFNHDADIVAQNFIEQFNQLSQLLWGQPSPAARHSSAKAA